MCRISPACVPYSVVTEFMIKNLGLEICADTIIGNAMKRGVSGGQKKRVTTGADEPLSAAHPVLHACGPRHPSAASTSYLLTCIQPAQACNKDCFNREC